VIVTVTSTASGAAGVVYGIGTSTIPQKSDPQLPPHDCEETRSTRLTPVESGVRDGDDDPAHGPLLTLTQAHVAV
jgi:hypothetical protein